MASGGRRRCRTAAATVHPVQTHLHKRISTPFGRPLVAPGQRTDLICCPNDIIQLLRNCTGRTRFTHRISPTYRRLLSPTQLRAATVSPNRLTSPNPLALLLRRPHLNRRPRQLGSSHQVRTTYYSVNSQGSRNQIQVYPIAADRSNKM